jgi:predicted RecB family nuclease
MVKKCQKCIEHDKRDHKIIDYSLTPSKVRSFLEDENGQLVANPFEIEDKKMLKKKMLKVSEPDLFKKKIYDTEEVSKKLTKISKELSHTNVFVFPDPLAFTDTIQNYIITRIIGAKNYVSYTEQDAIIARRYGTLNLNHNLEKKYHGLIMRLFTKQFGKRFHWKNQSKKENIVIHLLKL